MNDLNRRRFLSGSVAAALPRVLAAQSPEPVNVGVIGNGIRGTFLIESLMKLPGVSVKALCDIKPDRLDKAASKAARDNPVTFTDYRALLERKDIQAVLIAIPCDLHVEMAIAAVQANKHVYWRSRPGSRRNPCASCCACRGIEQGVSNRPERRYLAAVVLNAVASACTTAWWGKSS